MQFFKKYSKWVAAFIFAVAVITVYKTYDNLSNITKGIGFVFKAASPIFGGFIIAYILNLPAMKIEILLKKLKFKYIRKHSTGISVLIVYLTAIGLLVWISLSLFPMLYRNLLDLYSNIPSYINGTLEFINNLEIVRDTEIFDTAKITEALYGMFNKIDVTQLGKYAQGVFNITSGFFKAFIAIVTSIYMILDKKRISNKIKRLMSMIWGHEKAHMITEYASTVNRIFTNYLYSRLVCSIIMAIACSMVLSLMRVKYAVVLGMFIGVMDMIPYFGSIISSVIASIITVLTGGLFKGCYTAAVLLVMQQLDGNVLAPKIMGETLEMRPLVIIIAVTLGGTLFGFMGMLLSVPIAAIGGLLLEGLIKNYEYNKKIKMKREEEWAE